MLSKIVRAENRGALSLYILNDARGYSDPFLNAADAFSALGSVEAQQIFDASASDARLYLITSVIVVFIRLINRGYPRPCNLSIHNLSDKKHFRSSGKGFTG